MNQSEIIIIVPTYNNPTTIKAVAEDVLAHGYKIIIVDDGSDKIIEELFTAKEKENIIFVRHDINQGKGKAIISGALRAKKLGYKHILTIDGDGQHLASQAHLLVDECDIQSDEIIIGARNFNLDNVPKPAKFGRWFSNLWACWDTGYEITDSLSGYRIYPVSIVELPIKTQRFDWEMEVLVRHADAGKKIKEVEIECYYPLAEDRVSHFRNFEDTMTIVWVHLQILPFKVPGMIRNALFKK